MDFWTWDRCEYLSPLSYLFQRLVLRGSGVVTADLCVLWLTGGLDSTGLCFGSLIDLEDMACGINAYTLCYL